MTIPAGSLLETDDASYTVEGPAGVGGFGIVCRVIRDGDGEVFAAKIMQPPDTRGYSKKLSSEIERKARQRFEREWMMLCELGDIEIAQVMAQDAGYYARSPQPFPRCCGCGEFNGIPFYVMEWLEPVDLKTIDTDEKRQRYLQEVCDAVQTLHGEGYVHYDLKPSNIMRRRLEDGENGYEYVLTDFGSVHRAEEHAPQGPAPMNTISRLSNGARLRAATPGYADPMDDLHTVHADIYALGQIVRDLFAEEVPLFWSPIINKCTSRYYGNRYASVAEIKEDVENIKRMRFREYRRLRIAQIAAELDAQRVSARYPQHSATWDELLKGCQKTRGSVNEWVIDFRIHDLFDGKPDDCRVKGRLVLPPRTILTLTGPGMLHCEISGPSNSAVVLCNDFVLHNGSRQGTRGDRCAYIQTGGTYLNFTDKSALSPRVKIDVEKRVFRSMSAYTELGFRSCENLFDVRKAGIARARSTSLPTKWKRKLVNYMKGGGFVYYEGRG